MKHWVSLQCHSTTSAGSGSSTARLRGIRNITGYPAWKPRLAHSVRASPRTAASLAGHLGLDNLCWIYDNNHITIEGNTSITFTEDIATRFLGYGWNVLRVGDANDIDLIERALGVFHKTNGRPTFIILDSHIGYGSPHKQDTPPAHGGPLGGEEDRLTKRGYGWAQNAKIAGPDGLRDHFA